MNTSDNSIMDGLMQDKLWLKVIYGLILGVIVGYILGPDLNIIARDTAEAIGGWLALPGNLFLTLIRFIVIPLVISSIALGICTSGDGDSVKKLGFGVVAFFVLTTGAAVVIGVLVTKGINPGSFISQALVEEKLGAGSMDVATGLSLGDGPLYETINNIFPTNPMTAMAEGALLKIVISAAIFGIALLAIPAKESKPLIDLLFSVQASCMAIVGWLMKFAPIAVFGLLANVMIIVGFEAFQSILIYVVTFIVALLLVFTMYMVLLLIMAKRSPLEFVKSVIEPMVIGFSTSSSSATMPVTMRAIETNLNVHPTISRLVIPLGATINMGGTAVYQAVVVLFLSQVFGVELGFAELSVLLVLAISSSIGAPGVPGGSLGMLITILISVGIPAEGVALVLSVDRILDMLRTSVNITGDMVAATIMDKKMNLPHEKGEQLDTWED